MNGRLNFETILSDMGFWYLQGQLLIIRVGCWDDCRCLLAGLVVCRLRTFGTARWSSFVRDLIGPLRLSRLELRSICRIHSGFSFLLHRSFDTGLRGGLLDHHFLFYDSRPIYDNYDSGTFGSSGGSSSGDPIGSIFLARDLFWQFPDLLWHWTSLVWTAALIFFAFSLSWFLFLDFFF